MAKRKAYTGGGGMSVDVKGIDELGSLLHALPRNSGRRIMRSALRGSVNMIAKHVKSITPVLQEDKAGRIRGALKRGIKVRATKRSRRGFGYVILLPDRVKLGIGRDEKYYYPTVVEYGDHDTPAHSFLRKGWDHKERAAMSMFRDAIEDGIDREAARLSR